MTDRTPETTLRPFFVLWSAQTLSLVGSGAVQFALIWWLTAQTGSAAVLATATLLGLLPQVVLGPVIGALIDRWNRKQVMLFADKGYYLMQGMVSTRESRTYLSVFRKTMNSFKRRKPAVRSEEKAAEETAEEEKAVGEAE